MRSAAVTGSARSSFRALLLANLRVLAIVSVIAALAFGLWYAAAELFPEIGWLQIGGTARR